MVYFWGLECVKPSFAKFLNAGPGCQKFVIFFVYFFYTIYFQKDLLLYLYRRSFDRLDFKDRVPVLRVQYNLHRQIMFFTRAVATVTLLALSSLSAQTVAESPPPREQTTTHDPESTTERTPQTSCKLKGCHPVLGYHADDPCQCDEQCTNDGSCCDDYASQVKATKSCLFVFYIYIKERVHYVVCMCACVCAVCITTRVRVICCCFGGVVGLGLWHV